jgi:hypothetical protein
MSLFSVSRFTARWSVAAVAVHDRSQRDGGFQQ